MSPIEKEGRSHVFKEIENLDNPNHIRAISMAAYKSNGKPTTASPRNWKLRLRASSDGRGQNEVNKQFQSNSAI